MKPLSLALLVGSAAVVGCLTVPASGETLGTATISDADHYGYWGFGSTSQFNTKATVGPFSGTARVIRIEGSVTKVQEDAWASSIRVRPSGGALAVNQPTFWLTDQQDFEGTLPVSATVYAPGGFDLSQPLNFEMFSIDSEEFVPGLDARSTLTYTFESEFAPGTAEFTGTLDTGDPTFNRPIQFPANFGGVPGWTDPFLSGQMPYYDVQPFHVDAAGRYDLVTANEFESAAVLYAGSFDPKNSLENVVWAFSQTGNVLRNDSFNDLDPADDATGGSLITADLVPGMQYYFVTSAYAAPGGAEDGGPFVGDYSNIITGAGNVSLGLVPEPTAALSAVALGSLGLLRRSRRSHR